METTLLRLLKKHLLIALLCILAGFTGYAQPQAPTAQNKPAPAAETPGDSIDLIIRADDMGMCHAVNVAEQKLMESGLPFSTSVMVTCPWYQEAASILKKHPETSAGVHLTLNSEWKGYRWGPVLGQEGVPTLVNENGFFFHSASGFFGNEPDMDEIERELRAQIERALKTGMKLDYIDYHMGTAAGTPELKKLLLKLGREYGLGVSGFFNEARVSTYRVPYKEKKQALIDKLKELKPGKTYVFVCHLGLDNPELSALKDMNEGSPLSDMSKHRNAQLETLLSRDFLNAVKKYKINLMTYREFIAQQGMEAMEIPEDLGY